MPNFSQASRTRLATCHQDLQDLMNEVVKGFDIKIIEGHRTEARQQDLFAQGRTKPGPVVTNCDGILKKSKHQSLPSIAIDVAPYPINWNNTNRFWELGGFVQATALRMNIKVKWGGHFNTIVDLPHWEVFNDRSNLYHT